MKIKDNITKERNQFDLSDCRFKLDPTEGEVRSPFYPEIYGTSFQCTWSLAAPPGSLVHILIARLRLDQGDFLHVSQRGSHFLENNK